jgi:hypothetical protein
MIRIHRTADDEYHPAPDAAVPWVVRDARGFAVIGPPCARCGACECLPCPCHGEPIHERGCVGLSYAYVRADTFEALCESCARLAAIEVVTCDCPEASAATLGDQDASTRAR